MKKNKKETDPAGGETSVEELITAPERRSIELTEAVLDTELELKDLYSKMATSDDPEQFKEEVETKLRSYKRTSANIRRAYQHCVSAGDELAARWSDLTKGKHRKFIPAAPANSIIDLEEERANHFARGLSIYKLMLVCFVGSFAGVVIEMLWCLLTRGYIESRAGLVYGPFNLLYGAGAVVLTLSLYQFRNKGKWISFAGGLIVGSAVEYVCSWWQETVFGSRSWDYSHMPFNINGRICLLYSIFWGVLGVMWVKMLYPWMAKLILRIPNRVGKIITWSLTAFLTVNAIVTVVAVFRWSQRLDLIEPANAFWEFIDMRFPDERMERVFANMAFN